MITIDYNKMIMNQYKKEINITKSILSIILVSAVLFCTHGMDIRCRGSCISNEKNKKVAITFDDGPHGQYTPEILDILDYYKIPATFFVIGTNADKYPEIVKREITSGHEIGSHTYYHRHISSMNIEELKDDLELNEQKIMELTGVRPTLFRPPEGICNDSVKSAAREMGYSIIMWTVDTNDWQALPAKKIVQCVKKNVSADSIILFHDYVSGDSGTPEALNEIIPYLLDSGYVFVTVSQLLNLKA